MRLLTLCFLLLILNCTSVAEDRFTYVTINEVKHLEVTPDNLIQLYELPTTEVQDLLKTLDYKKMDGPFDYILKADTLTSDWQTVATRAINNSKLSICWVSATDNDKNRLQSFRDLASAAPHAYSVEQDVYLLRKNGKTYLASINDLVVGTEVVITDF